jgi:dihydropteroate synthase
MKNASKDSALKGEFFKCGRFDLDISPNARPLIVGILNVTPDSFSDGGKFCHLEAALSHAEQMLLSGADILDIGGESTRPGATPLPLQEELARVMPVLYALRDCGKPLSVDTYKPEVMREVLAAGADMINDVKGFRDSAAIAAVDDSDCGLCIMHMQNTPTTMQQAPQYEDVVADVSTFLQQRVQILEQADIDRRRLCIDPGFGFGKSLAHNLALLQNLRRISADVNLPILAGVSRKSMIGQLTGRATGERLIGSVVAALSAATHGAKFLRVHDVAETVDALNVWYALQPDSTKEQRQGNDNDT